MRLLILLAGAAGLASAQRVDTTVKMATAPVHQGKASLVREVSIGVLDGPDEYSFGDISEIAVAPDGSIYAFDRHVPALRKYGADGKYIKTFGRKGAGPGEYLNPGGLAIAPDGRVFLWDAGNWRINVYAPDGSVLPSISTVSGATGSASIGTSKSLMIDSAGFLYIRRPLFTAARLTRSTQVWIRYRPDGTPLDTIQMPAPPVEPRLITVTSPEGSAMSSAGVPFAPQFQFAMSPRGYLVTGYPQKYAFEIHTGPSRVVSVRRPVPSEPVTSGERDSARTALEKRMRQTNPSWSWNGGDIPATKPAYTQILVGSDGRVWIPILPELVPSSAVSLGGGVGRGAPQTRTSSTEPDNVKYRPALFDVYEPNGAWLGQVETPARFSSVFRRGDYVWGIQYGEDDVESIARYRIVWK